VPARAKVRGLPPARPLTAHAGGLRADIPGAVLLLFVFGIGLVAGAVVAVVTWGLLRGHRSVRWVAPLAGVAAGATWVLFALDWVFYSVLENQPSYYPHSDYVQYRRAQDGLGVVASGLGYTLLAGSLVGIAEALRRRQGLARWWAAAAALVAGGAIALPLVVPASLPRAEFGKDPVFYLSKGPPIVDPATGNSRVCFMYGVQRPGPEPPGGPSDPEVCLDFRPSGELDTYDVQNALNESSVRPHDPVPADAIDTEGLELERAQWTGALEPPPRPLATPPEELEEVGEARKRALERDLRRRDRATKHRVARVAGLLRRCEARTKDYRRCSDPADLRRAGVPLGPGPGQVRVTARGRHGFAIQSFSARGGQFGLSEFPSARVLRTCEIRGSGACPADGFW
jgi:hypothetical protein